MTEPSLSLWQRFRHYRFVREYKQAEEHRSGCGSVITKNGQLLKVIEVVGYKWKLSNGGEVTVADLADVGEAKWLYRLYC